MKNGSKFILFALATMAMAPTLASPGQFNNSREGAGGMPKTEFLETDQNKETAEFFKAKEYVLKQDWGNARVGLERYLSDYSSGQMTDEALYWLAQTLNRLSSNEQDADRVFDLREKAVGRINELMDRFENSRWKKDAELLRARISRSLFLFGLSAYSMYISREQMKAFDPIQPAVLGTSIAEITKEAAFPILAKLSKDSPSRSVRSCAAFLLAQDYREEAMPILQAVSLGDPDEGIRRDALSIIERIRMSLIPVHLEFFEYVAKIKDKSDMGLLVEDKVNLLSLPHGAPGEEGAKAAIRSALKIPLGELRPLATYYGDSYFGPLSEGWGSYSSLALSFSIINSDLRKESNRITGAFKFIDTKTEERGACPFSVNAERDQLIAIPRGNNMFLLYLHFEPFLSEPVNPIRDVFRKNMNYQPERADIFGSKILFKGSSTWKFGQTTELGDLGSARAEIPGLGGIWILEGQLLFDKKALLFIGRQYTLTDPKGKVVAKGALIEVPADSPQSFRIK